MEPWAPEPCRVISIESPAERTGPALVPMVPASWVMTCWPSTTSGAGTFSVRPSSTMERAPAAISSPGWNSAMNVPDHASWCAAIAPAAPSSAATCMSWPQACISGTVRPSSSVVVSVEA